MLSAKISLSGGTTRSELTHKYSRGEDPLVSQGSSWLNVYKGSTAVNAVPHSVLVSSAWEWHLQSLVL